MLAHKQSLNAVQEEILGVLAIAHAPLTAEDIESRLRERFALAYLHSFLHELLLTGRVSFDQRFWRFCGLRREHGQFTDNREIQGESGSRK